LILLFEGTSLPIVIIGFVVAGAKNPVYDKLYRETLEVNAEAAVENAAAVSTIVGVGALT